MEFCIEVAEVVVPKLKRLKIKPQVLKPFLIDLVCCIMGLRNAYLVDGISIEIATIREICQVVYSSIKASAAKSKSAPKIQPNVICGEAVRGRASGGGSGALTAGPAPGTLAPSKVLLMQLNEFDNIVCNLTVFYCSYRSISALGLDRVTVDVTNGPGGTDPGYCGRVCCASERAVLASQLLLLFEALLPTIEAAIDSQSEHIVLSAVTGRSSLVSSVASGLTSPHAANLDLPMVCIPLPDRLSFAFLAGWLLNYSCIYHFERMAEADDVDSGGVACLCNQQLQKFSVICTPARSGSASSRPVVLMEFTVPVGLLLVEYDGGSNSCSVESHIVGCLDQHVASIGALLDADSSGLSYARDIVCEPCIVL